MAILDVGSLSIASIGAVDYLADIDSVTARISPEMKRIDSITRAGHAMGRTKLGVHFTADLMSSKTAPERVSHLDLSVLTLGATNLLPFFQKLSFNGKFEQKDRPGGGQLFKTPTNVTKDYSISMDLGIYDDGVVAALLVASTSATPSDLVGVISFTLNGVVTTNPMTLTDVDLKWERDGLQMVTLQFTGRDPGTGIYPTLPTATTTLLGKAFNAFKTALAFEFESAATNGWNLSGNMIFSGFSFDIADGELVVTKYEFDSTGTVTGTVSS